MTTKDEDPVESERRQAEFEREAHEAAEGLRHHMATGDFSVENTRQHWERHYRESIANGSAAPFYLRIVALLDRIEKLERVAAAARRRSQDGHARWCPLHFDAHRMVCECVCGQIEIEDALRALDGPQESGERSGEERT